MKRRTRHALPLGAGLLLMACSPGDVDGQSTASVSAGTVGGGAATVPDVATQGGGGGGTGSLGASAASVPMPASSAGGTGNMSSGGARPGGAAADSGTRPPGSAAGGSGGATVVDAGPPPPSPGPCHETAPELSVEMLETTSIADMGTPFDPNRNDLISPANWNTNYGKAPELIPVVHGNGFDVLWRDTRAPEPMGYVVRIEPQGETYVVTRAYRVELLGNLMGFTRDEQGDYYYATGVNEDDDIDEQNPPPGVHRPNIVRVVRFSPDGCVQMESDVGLARQTASSDAEPIVNPMVAGSSRLAYGDGQLSLVHSINTAPDDNAVRHQKALTTHLDAETGAATRTSTMWVSHSFDQRLLWDGQGFVELHLGDAFPRQVALGRFTATQSAETYGLYAPKGAQGDNATYTRLGGIAPVASGDYGYLVVFATDRSTELGTQQWQALVGSRDVALVRVRRDFAEMRPRQGGYVDTSGSLHRVQSAGEAVDNYVHWLTDYGDGEEEVYAGRPRTAALEGDRFIVLWERWEAGERREQFTGTYGLEIDAEAQVLTPAIQLSESHIPRGDDLLSLGDRVVWVYGDEEQQSLVLEFAASGLEAQELRLP